MNVVLCNPTFAYSSNQPGVVETGATPEGCSFTLLNLPQTAKGDQVLIESTSRMTWSSLPHWSSGSSSISTARCHWCRCRHLMRWWR